MRKNPDIHGKLGLGHRW